MIESFAPGECSTLLIKRQAMYQMKGVCKNKLLKLFNLFDFLQVGKRGFPLPPRGLAHPHLPRLLHRHRPLCILRGQEQLQNRDPSSQVSFDQTLAEEECQPTNKEYVFFFRYQKM